MHKYSLVTFFSRFLLLVILNVAIDGVFKSVHAESAYEPAARDLASSCALPHSHCSPLEHHHDSDDCAACINCICHSLLPAQTIQLEYNPIVIGLGLFEPFKLLPEVFLSRFIPPQNRA
jgi:hypothetical protein